MAAASRLVALVILVSAAANTAGGTWCVVRSEVSDQILQAALDYACGAGADCAPLRSSGLCHLPNTVQAHASYAFNSYYQRKGQSPAACFFAGAGTIASTDPSYGSCVYPSSPRTAGLTGGGAGALPATIIEPPRPEEVSTPFYGGVLNPPPGTGMSSGASTLPNSPDAWGADASMNEVNFNHFTCFLNLILVLIFQVM